MKKLLALIFIASAMLAMEPQETPCNLLKKADSFYYGFDKKKIDYKKAYSAYQELVEKYPQNLPAFLAQIMMLWMLQEGEGVEKNLTTMSKICESLYTDWALDPKQRPQEILITRKRLELVGAFSKLPQNNSTFNWICQNVSDSQRSLALLFTSSFRDCKKIMECSEQCKFIPVLQKTFDTPYKALTNFIDETFKLNSITSAGLSNFNSFLHKIKSDQDFYHELVYAHLSKILSPVICRFYPAIWQHYQENKDLSKAIPFLNQIATLDFMHESECKETYCLALYKLGNIFFKGDKEIAKNYLKAAHYFTKLLPLLANESDQLKKQEINYMMGHMYLIGGNEFPPTYNPDAKKYFMKATTGPCSYTSGQAYLKLGSIILHHLEQNPNYAIAEKYFKKACQADSSFKIECQALCNLGFLYFKGGYGIEKNILNAQEYLMKIALNNKHLYVKYFASNLLGDIFFDKEDDDSLAQASHYYSFGASQTKYPALQEYAKNKQTLIQKRCEYDSLSYFEKID